MFFVCLFVCFVGFLFFRVVVLGIFSLFMLLCFIIYVFILLFVFVV